MFSTLLNYDRTFWDYSGVTARKSTTMISAAVAPKSAFMWQNHSANQFPYN